MKPTLTPVRRRTVLKRGALTIGAITVGGTALSGTVAAGIGDGRVVDYNLNNLKRGGTVKDASQEKNHGVWEGGERPVSKDGVVGNAFEFNGSDSIDVPINDSLTEFGDFSYSLWINPNSLPDDDWVFLIRQGDNGDWFGSPNTSFVLTLDNRDGIQAVRGDIHYPDNDNFSARFDLTELPSNGWSHLAFVRQGDTAKLYLNGGTPEDTDTVHSTSTENYPTLTIGGDPLGNRGFDGLLDDVRIYDRAITNLEITELVDRPYGIGPFLNEEAMWKESPVWGTGVADRTGEEEVDVLFGGMTSINLPFPDTPDMGPWGMDPRAVKVSPGTDVTWTWYDGPGAIDAHHLASYFDPPYDEEFVLPWEDQGHEHDHPGGDDEFYVHEDLGETYTHTFDETGIYLYFCIPHGTPFSFEFPELGEVSNLFGQRGAVIVTDE